MRKVIIFGGIVTAIVLGVVLTFTFISTPTPTPTPTSNPVVESEIVSNFPIKVDFARVIPYKNTTDYYNDSMGYIMHIRLLYSEEGPPRPFYLLLSSERGVWDDVTDPRKWINSGTHNNHGFEVLSSSKEFDLFTEFFPFNPNIIPLEMRLYCPDCEEQFSEPHTVWQGVKTKITKIKGVLVKEGEESYEVGFALGNEEIDSLPAQGAAEFKITDPIGVTLYETIFEVNKDDFVGVDESILYLRVPLGGKASYFFTIPTDQIKSSPSGKTKGFAFINFMLDNGTIISGGTKGFQLPMR